MLHLRRLVPLLVALLVLPRAVDAQTPAVGPGSWVRIEGPERVLIAQGRILSLTSDSLVLESATRRGPTSLAATRLRDRMAEVLGQQGIVVARRTVAKYRDALRIAPANLRRAL